MTTMLEPITTAPPAPRAEPVWRVDAGRVPPATAELVVRYFREPQSGLWGFAVESPAILGGGCRTREEAEQYAVEAVVRSLRHCPTSPTSGDDIGYLHVEVRPAVRER